MQPDTIPQDILPQKEDRPTPKPPRKSIEWLRRHKKLVAAIVAVLLLAVIAVVFWLSTRQVGTDAPVASTALSLKVAKLEGVLESSSDGKTWQKVKRNDTFEGAPLHLRTGKDSRASIALDDNSAVSLASESQLKLEKATNGKVEIRVKNGQTYHRVDGNELASYIVQAGTSSFVSKGTAFLVEHAADKTILQVYEHAVEAKTDKKGTDVKEGEQYTVDADAKVNTSPLNLEEVKKNTFLLWVRSSEADNAHTKDKLGFLSDINNPELTVSEPTADASVNASVVVVKGTVETGASVQVNNVNVEVKDGAFATEVALTVGANTITVQATDKAGNVSIQNIKVTRKSQTATPQPTPSNPVPQPGQGDFADGIALNGSLSGSSAALRWEWGKNIDASSGFQVHRRLGGEKYSASPIFTVGAYVYSTSASLPDEQTYFFTVCPKGGTPPTDNRCSNSFVISR